MILLTGATGLAGSFIANEFVRAREPVRILVRDRAKAAALGKAPTVEITEADMSGRDSLTAALDGVERVLMISGSRMDMVETQCTFIDACRAAGVRHVIKFSGLDARWDTTFPFGLMHKQIEQHLEKSGIAWTHLRPTGFMQEYLREAPSIIRENALYLALGDVRLNPVDLLDVGKVGFLLLRRWTRGCAAAVDRAGSADRGGGRRPHFARNRKVGAVRRRISDPAPAGANRARYPAGDGRCVGQAS